jgi:hypothetical protein
METPTQTDKTITTEILREEGLLRAHVNNILHPKTDKEGPLRKEGLLRKQGRHHRDKEDLQAQIITKITNTHARDQAVQDIGDNPNQTVQYTQPEAEEEETPETQDAHKHHADNH